MDKNVLVQNILKSSWKEFYGSFQDNAGIFKKNSWICNQIGLEFQIDR